MGTKFVGGLEWAYTTFGGGLEWATFVGSLEWADTTFGGSLEWAGTTFGFLLDRELVAKLLFNYVHVIIDNVTHQLHIPPL